ncbi:hypothetical protein SPRG_03525 [Saprolegnia parasitica CBS 223.65]|uniref:EGF-like domain-containing protein n=1 Tax=Saprolegnia parasitica (strain CBS 223.65) TaxID=695850 RepID=A0A067CYJ7_SAPPC|nr:hypothetical protein SPRG_03525 [Saprolegnia parasitica CBS 223.65]KDO31596.1 hypothetical protein SPRG_03525 [Saprolegnia parasitica CBS 223.65]|eukprot:XP_012197495.1 hypothetical protein SPRG_03525 [Saprolegnia parasitica CBS 223.65]
MKLVLALATLLSVASFSTAAIATKAPVPTRNRFNGVCSSDEECAPFPGTVCVFILSGDYTQGKCTPNYGKRPVCRGGQAGLCPSYQDPSSGYLNTQCVLIDKAMQPATDTDAIVPVNKPTTAAADPDATPADSGAKPSVTPAKTAASRFLAADPTTAVASDPTTTPKKTTAAPAADGTDVPADEPTTGPTTPKKTTAAPLDDSTVAPDEGSTTADGTVSRIPVKDQPCPSDPTLVLADPKCWFTTAFKNTTLTVQYKCVDYDMCLSQSAYAQEPQTIKEEYCRPKGCANSAIDVMLPRVYACRCYAGYTGTKCEKSDPTGECDVDCGQGGACIDNKCSCFDGFIGKNIRCDKCTSNKACENNNTCNIDTGKCDCKNGFNGETCGGKLDICAGVTCSGGGFPDGRSGKTCTCLCPKCAAGTTCMQCGGANGRDCSTCPASARPSSGTPTLSVAIMTLIMAILAVLF